MKPILSVLTLLFPLSLWAQSPVVGKWKTIDDESGKAKSIVEITQKENEFKAHIVELIEPEKPNPVCEKCSGEKKDKPITGMEILWGMNETTPNEEWTGGQIMDPNNGKTYKCRLRIKDGGQKLEVRGFIGFSLIGRSQIWHKVP